jgi:hypothetical protein
MKENEFSDDRIKKIIWALSARRDKLLSRLCHPPPMLKGCIQSIYKKCGSPSCKCKDGSLHGPYWILSAKQDSKTKTTYLKEGALIRQALAYQKYNKDMASIRKTNEKIFYWLKILRDKHAIVL